MAIRAARFPSGRAAGAAGPGVAERAIRVDEAPFEAEEEAISGEGPTSLFELREEIRGAAPALISSFGRAGWFELAAIEMSAGRVSLFRTSGLGRLASIALDFFWCGRRLFKTLSLISIFGRAGIAV